MYFRKTMLASTIVLALTMVGCGGDSSSSASVDAGDDVTTPDTPVETSLQGVFVDAVVEGLYYQSQPSGLKGFTDAAGLFDYEDGDLVTFFIGGEEGLRIGQTNARSVVSPFEVTGSYQKSLNLARILQSAGDTTEQSITLPDSLKSPDANMLAALNSVLLHDMDSVEDLKEELAVEEWVSEDEALSHLNNSLKDLDRGDKSALVDWSKGSQAYLRQISTTLSSDKISVHADKLLNDELFMATVGSSAMVLQLNEDNLVVLEGSNDTTISGDQAGSYLACLDAEGLDADFDGDGNGSGSLCNGETIVNTKFVLGDAFEYVLLDVNAANEEDESVSWDEVTEFGGMWSCIANASCSEGELTKFSIVEFDDSEDGEEEDLRRDVLSGSYDKITGIYTEVKKTTHLSGDNAGRTSQSISFTYPVSEASEERYVDFIGTWQAVTHRDGCAGSTLSTYVFNAEGLTVTGKEFYSNCETEEMNETVTYTELAAMDYWWFTMNDAGASKATLAQLNSTIRWCDSDELQDTCEASDEKMNRWQYQPAGTDWDKGTLIRQTLSSAGSVTDITSMYKQ
ncbi:hypothetical protein A9264_13145 [Vibrio sp. UCD-FRSSP16_10]|uniref:hypothetical protein n=1 Tax=unclassified Vibrio TaxID=2614977 RepID=UPI0007FE47F3|nr:MULTISPECIES: hypothetical protein [unclassified Vibrio]OBT15500.1 hypothetical protein A9260_13360 [Vibrio sp. UCD-FRSSP16_30]OBT20573.1 hypothetical protein A9264_13145 [Vibrio sp. UCD-FRSSP16_10]